MDGTDPVTLQPTSTSFFEYAHRDHLGSIELITDAAGSVRDRLAFEPFGLRKSADWSANASAGEVAALLARSVNHPPRVHGFTAHEHLDRSGFIHLNGRVYDPVLGRFLSPDPYVQFPAFSQSRNRYSYVLNTPTSLIDPSGFTALDLDDFDLDFDWGWNGFWGSVDYYDPVNASDGGPLSVPEHFGEGRYRNQNLTADLGAVLETLGREGYAILIGDTIDTAIETYGHVREGNILKAGVGIATLGCDLAKACKLLGEIGGRVAKSVAGPVVDAVRKRLGRAADNEVARKIPDDAVVVRGGQSEIPPSGQVFSGAAGRSLEDAAQGVPHGTVRASTAGQIRAGGGTVTHAPEPTRSGAINDKHVNVCVGSGPCPFGPPQTNPVPKSQRAQ